MNERDGENLLKGKNIQQSTKATNNNKKKKTPILQKVSFDSSELLSFIHKLCSH
jgi:hypothetical protein